MAIYLTDFDAHAHGIVRRRMRANTRIFPLSRARLIGMRDVKPDSTHTIVDIVEAQARTTPDAVAVLLSRLDHELCGIWTPPPTAMPIGRGRTASGAATSVALLMENRPDYIVAWLGLFKVGAQVALINTNLRGTALAHSIAIRGARHAIVGAELADSFRERGVANRAASDRLERRRRSRRAEIWTAALAMLCRRLARRARRRDGHPGKDRAFFIYTSGTTGLPKAANFSHMRMLFMMSGFVGALNASADDRIYDPLPLYHSTGGVCAVGLAFFTGGA